MAERAIAAVLKTARGRPLGSSNLPPSAMHPVHLLAQRRAEPHLPRDSAHLPVAPDCTVLHSIERLTSAERERSREAFYGSIARIARHDEHRDLHVHADLSITEIRERADERLAVSGHVTRDGRGDVLVLFASVY